MGTVAAADVIALAVRAVFIVFLYCLVAAVLLNLRRHLSREAVATESPPRRQARLQLLEAAPSDGPVGRVVPLDGNLTIGRRDPCTVILRDDAVSGQHARFTARDGGWEVEDLGSMNGTYRNGRRLVAAARLQPGDVVTTGIAAWRFDMDDP